jgi:signal transduction histidine kinase
MFKHAGRGLSTIAGLALVYFLACKLGLRLAVASPSATPVWPGTGIALAALLLMGLEVWPAILIGSFFVNVLTAGTVLTSLAIAAGNTLEALCAAYLINRFANGRRALRRGENVFKFATSLALGCLIAASVGAAAVAKGGFTRGADVSSIWLTWWLGDFVGGILLASCVILWVERSDLPRDSRRRRQGAAAGLSLLLVGLLVFGGLLPSRLWDLPLGFLCIPLVVWAAFRLRPHESATAVLLLCGIAVWGTLRGAGGFANGSEKQSLLLLQGFMGVVAMTSLVLSAAEFERENHEISRIRTENRLQLAQAAAQIGTWEWDPVSNKSLLSQGLHDMFGVKEGDSDHFKAWSSQVDPEDWSRVQAEMRAGNRSGTMEFEYRYRHPQRGLRWFYCRGDRVSSDDANMFGVVLDITERKAVEEELRRAQHELEQRVSERTADLKSAETSLRALSSRLLQMQDEERRRIARELHDSSGQMLAALNLNLGIVRAGASSLPPSAQRALEESTRCVDQLSQELRTMSYLLHPPLLDEMGLRSAVQWYVEGFSKRSQIQVELTVSPLLGRLPRDLETAVFRVIQECLTNIHRHSGSPTARVSIDCDAEAIIVEVRDEGKGLQQEKASKSGDALNLGVGIQGMRERVRQLGGQFDIQSSSGGTVVTVSLPVPRADEDMAGSGADGSAVQPQPDP